MNDDARVRLFLLVGLTAIGVSLAGAGVALGVGDRLAAGDRTGEVSVTGTNVTVSSSDGDVVLMENLSDVSDIEITEDGGGITVAERDDSPFTRSERERAVEIARTNGTVESYLETIETPDISVEPIEKLSLEASESTTVEFDVNGTNDTIASGEGVQIVNVSVEESDGSVKIDREPSYVEDEAVVRIGSSARERSRYWVKVDLAIGTVTDVTDWDAVSQSP
ncbi:hypothetical protein [Halorhabdus amylolytica]|uniref:hypothetical protein n=1 Tax=Halorhabdus amylolytica TaxID=2559573 RepID=UPI0010AAD21E|nr:hypothetical protein [Halorhabdus amylolytica]